VLLSRKPPNRKTQILWYLAVQIQIEILVLFEFVLGNLSSWFDGLRGCSNFSGTCHIDLMTFIYLYVMTYIYIYDIKYCIWQFPLKQTHHLETQIFRYLVVQIQIEISLIFKVVPRNLIGGLRGVAIQRSKSHISYWRLFICMSWRIFIFMT